MIMAKRRVNRYIVAQPYVANRLKNSDWQDSIVEKWTFFPKAPHLHNNLVMYSLYFNSRKKVFELTEKKDFITRLESSSIGSVISSSLAVYRLMCIFGYPPVMPPREDQYKSLWEYPLKHRKTGKYLTLLDYKAGFTVNTMYSEYSEMPLEFAMDMLELLSLLVSKQVAHPYDGTLAGTVA